MGLLHFQSWVRERWARDPRDVDLAVMALGLAGEAGEVIEPIKKFIRGSHPAPGIKKLTSELGDVLHYLTAIANHFNISLDDIVEDNMSKLVARDHRDPKWLGEKKI